MELVYAVGSPEGAACALVASYAFPPGSMVISALGANAAKAAGQTPRLYTPDGELHEPVTIIHYLCDKSDSREVLLGPEKNIQAQAEVDQWFSFCASRCFQIASSNDFNEFNTALQLRTFLCGNNLSLADLVAMASLYSAMRRASLKELQVYKNVTRWFSHMQNLPGIKEQRVQDFSKIELPTSSPDELLQAAKALGPSGKEEQQGKQQKQQQKQQQQQQKQQQQQQEGGKAGIEKRGDAASPQSAAEDKKKKGAAATAATAAAATAATAAAAAERPVDDPMRLDMRVGLVRKVWRHPEADKLYCEEIDFGPLGVRQIASGLVQHLQQQQFEQQKVIVLFNLKQKALRGFNSHGMVLCANSADKTAVQLLQPHPDTPLGERVYIEGLSGEPDEVLSSKKGKDTFAAVAPFLNTKDDCIAYFKVQQQKVQQQQQELRKQ
ncbi:multisynthetase complex auxiliary component p43, putative [Eimeria tenella]|uniref:Multisynthetase complex auxiliary component p43, putative n=1 Tax=Eimeria tenella TaxID=5802 RepID=U6KUL6_EIMTE|nr:multisynthetase complex auxiliary component p43, putative [Eimeria tenella]CDJ41651.1 multisynthetase complex auxiliary component p43, putative [Eimeria tenella]|eukprot:XP_013232401.1 multisynthetase complex auxiliary component p43, putative [Eimeria tenella]